MKKTMILYLMIITMLTFVACTSDALDTDTSAEAEVVTEETETVEIKKIISEDNKNLLDDTNEEKPRQTVETITKKGQEENNSITVEKKKDNLKVNSDSEKNTSTNTDKTAYNNNNSSSSKPVTNTAKSKKSTTSNIASTSDKTTTTKADTSSKTNSTKTKTSSKATTPKPVITTKNETKIETIDFKTVKQNDNTLDKGKEVVSREGEKGTRTIVYKITYTDGKQTDKVETSNTVTKQPVDKIIKVGTKEAPKKEVILDGQIGNSDKEFDTVWEAIDWANELYYDDERWFATGYGGWRAEPIFYGYILEDGRKKETRTTYTVIFFE